jgi:hypothetical protein
MKPLIIVSHFDDEILGCSSLLQYNPTILIICGNDERSKIIKSDLLCNYNYITFNYKALELQKITQSELVDKIKTATLVLDFDCVFTHSEFDNHSDHKIVSNACDIVFRANRTDNTLFAKFMVEPLNIAKFNETLGIKVDLDYKTKLLDLYKDYIPKSHLDLIINFNKYIGSKYNLGFAEPFEIIYKKGL